MGEQLSNLEIAKKIFESFGGEMSVHDIATKAAAAGMLVSTTVDAFVPRISSSLSSNVKRKDSPFSRVKNAHGGFKKGIYRLKKINGKRQELSIPEPEESADTGFIGRGGEYAVMSELLFRGFNVSLMSVDKGIDVIAANEQGKYFHIQVKTAKAKNGGFQFGIKRKSFENNNNSQTFYIFVLRKDTKSDFIVMPNSQVANYIALNVIKGVDTLSIRVAQDNKTRKLILNNGQDISIYANKFGQIR